MRNFTDEELLYDYRLTDLVRYNPRHKVKKESVAEHSYYVALYSLKICEHYDLPDSVTKNVLIKALLHDISEIEISDIPYNVKNNIKGLRDILERAERIFYSEFYPEYYSILYNYDLLENTIVKYADTLSVKQYCLNELKLSPMNQDMLEILENSNERLDNLRKDLEKYAEEQFPNSNSASDESSF